MPGCSEPWLRPPAVSGGYRCVYCLRRYELRVSGPSLERVLHDRADLAQGAGGIIDVHLMIERPGDQVAEFAHAGSDNITVRAKATPHLHCALPAMRGAGWSGAAIRSATPADALAEVAEETLDLALSMNVNPRWGAQGLIPASVGELERMRASLPDTVAREIDGGIYESSAPRVVGAGANLLVTGPGFFGSGDPAAAYRAIAVAERVR